MSAKTFQDIANELYLALAPWKIAKVQHLFTNGLAVILDCTIDTWRCSAGRKGKKIEADEMAIIRRCFNIPEGCRASHERAPIKGYWVTRWSYPRGEQTSFLDDVNLPIAYEVNG